MALDHMRRFEAALLITETVGNVIRYAPEVAELYVAIYTSSRVGARIVVSHAYPVPLVEPKKGSGFFLLDELAGEWGHRHDGSNLEIWFVIRKPGMAAIWAAMDDEELLSCLESHPGGASEGNCPGRPRTSRSDWSFSRPSGASTPELGDLRRYASATISGEMKRQLPDHGWSLRMPRMVQERTLQVTRLQGSLLNY